MRPWRLGEGSVKRLNTGKTWLAISQHIATSSPPASVDRELTEALAALRPERERQGLSLTDLAQRKGIDRATISKLETGKIPNPTVGTLKRYAAALGKSLNWELGDGN